MPLLPAYLLTWTTYGSWLDGDRRGSVDRHHNITGHPTLPPDSDQHHQTTARLTHPIVRLSEPARLCIHQTIEQVAARRCWHIDALNVRTNHVHTVIHAPSHPPEIVISQLKSWSTRRLTQIGLTTSGRPIWTKRGSTRWLNDQDSLSAAVDYVRRHQ